MRSGHMQQGRVYFGSQLKGREESRWWGLALVSGIHGQDAEISTPPPPFCLVWDPSPWDGVAHMQSCSSPFNKYSLKLLHTPIKRFASVPIDSNPVVLTVKVNLHLCSGWFCSCGGESESMACTENTDWM